jgi:putative tricarboxylic transport membrane protein
VISHKNAYVAIAAGVVGLGALALLGISDIGFGAGYDRIGPRFFPYVVGAGLVILGLAMAVSAGRRQPPRIEDRPLAPLTLRPLAFIAVGLLLYLVLLERAGFIIASSTQFWLVARAFHSQRPMRDAVAAVVLAVSVYIVFSDGLGLTLPAGVLEKVL